MKIDLPAKTLQRLTLYHSILKEFLFGGEEYISSQQIAQLLKIDASQVRKDINFCSIQGKSKVGYDVEELKKSIEKLLGFERKKDVFIVGAGNLGLALAKHDDFKDYGLNILALFDVDAQKVDQTINDKRIFHISKLQNLVNRMNVEIAILTVPAQFAQFVADILIASKIKYIWNFTPSVLDVPENIKVLNENLIGSFLNFTKETK